MSRYKTILDVLHKATVYSLVTITVGGNDIVAPIYLLHTYYIYVGAIFVGSCSAEILQRRNRNLNDAKENSNAQSTFDNEQPPIALSPLELIVAIKNAAEKDAAEKSVK